MKEEDEEELVGLKLEVPRGLRDSLKVHAAKNRITIKTLITNYLISITKPEEKWVS